jgi:catechol 2,3-dioxygenase
MTAQLDAPAGSGALPATTRLGPAHLTVTDLDRALAFYRDLVGLHLHSRSGSDATIGDGEEETLVLVEEPGARRAGRHAGLYHVALLYPTRVELARAALRLGASRTPIQGASDHGTHDAIYLADPDGNGVELAADNPREQWPSVEEMLEHPGPRPLNQRALFALVDGEEPRAAAGPGLRVGHVHLHVGDVAAAARFYGDVIGFDTMLELPGAVFVSAGGYHHHVGFNSWRGEGVAPVPPGTVGLRHFTVLLPTEEDVEAVLSRVEATGLEHEVRGTGFLVHDPAGNALLVGVDPAAP